MIKRIIPSTLIGRSIIIIFVPIIILVLLTASVFYQTSWNIISKRLAESVVADINVIVKLIDENLETYAIQIAKSDFKMEVKINDQKEFNTYFNNINRGILSKRLRQALEKLDKPFFYDMSNIDKGVLISIKLKERILQINVDKDRLYSETAFVFLLWMIFASLILLAMSYILMNKQLMPLKKLAIIAETFGRGLDAPELKSVGAHEIRQTSNAFNQMRTRIKRFLKQRTDMLAGVSHDLRTPLTRMKLQVSLIKDEKAKKELKQNIEEMTAMLNSYVNFVETESHEEIAKLNVNNILREYVKSFENKEINIIIKENSQINISGREIQIRRAFQNIIDNCQRYGTEINIFLFKNNDGFIIEFHDNGPGIPEDKYEDVFKPFFTLDPARNKLKGESGLGLTITRDIIRSHGGDISLDKSIHGGLKLIIMLPS